MATATINGVELYYQVAGSAGDWLVFVHGSWGDHHNWDQVAPLLSDEFRVVTYDRRGHSGSSAPEGQGSVQDDVADLAGLLAHLGTATAHIAGNSFGAVIVLRLAGARPDLFRALIAHEPPLTGLLEGEPEMQPVLAAVKARMEAVLQDLRAGDAASGAQRFVETVAFGPGAWGHLPDPLRQTFIRNAPTWLDEMQDPESFAFNLNILEGFTRPALLSGGDQSPPFFAPILANLAAALKRVERRTFPGAGHGPHVTHPQAYVEAVRDFIKNTQ